MGHPPDIHISPADWPQDQQQLRCVRSAVFVEELGIAEQLEWDGQDAQAVHLLAQAPDGSAVGTVRLLPDGRIGRLAVLRAYRGRGIGTALLTQLLELARRQGMRELHLHAQLTAIPFYRRFGFRTTGAVYTEADIPHQTMRLTVQ